MLGYRLLLLHLTDTSQHSDRLQFVIGSCYDVEFETLFQIFVLLPAA